MSKADYARHRGCTQAAVSRAIKEGRITTLAGGSIDPVAADAQWAQNSRARADSGRPARADGRAAGAEPGYWDSRARREQAEAELAEIELATKRQELISVAAVRGALGRVFSATRDSLLQIPSRLAPIIAAESDEALVHERLRAEIHQCLEHLASAPDRLGEAK